MHRTQYIHFLLRLLSCSSVSLRLAGCCGIHERHNFSSESVSVPAGDKHLADSPEAAGRRRTSLSHTLLAVWLRLLTWQQSGVSHL